MSTATGSRRALSNKKQHTPTIFSAGKGSQQSRPSSASFKRPRSPDPSEHLSASQSKRARASTTSTSLKDKRRDREDRHDRVDREQQKQEFKEKYSKAFPSFLFYFDLDTIGIKDKQLNSLMGRIHSLGGGIEDFFSREISHVITDKPITTTDSAKENRPNSRGTSSRSLHTVKSPAQVKSKNENDVVAKALGYGMKVWSTSKLDSVLCRCLDASSVLVNNPAPSKTAPTQKLERLLTKEKHYGAADRDSGPKRHDHRYFTKGSFFVLVEDMRGEVATIAAHEYTPPKDKQKVPWPVLHCHPHARGPFVAFDEKEKQRWERQQQKKLEEQANPPVEQKVAPRPRRNTLARPKIPIGNAATHGDLRRSVSLNNLRRKGQSPPENLDQDVEGDVFDSANASGFLVSGAAYMAASGNSVGITSTTGTTSTAGGFRTGHLPFAMDTAMKRQILTSKKVTIASRPEGRRLGTMDPPATLPTKNGLNLKKAKSMSFKPPKREEGMKPGYCESCRQKFEDFKAHIISSKHRRFAENDSNFVALDEILGRVKRRTLREVELEEQKRVERCYLRCNGLTSSSPAALAFPTSTP